MIYQLKLTIRDSKPPVWRRILIDSHSNFEELHDIIQVAFQWEDFHLHSFKFRKQDFYRIHYYIEPEFEDMDPLTGGESLNTFDEIIEDHLVEINAFIRMTLVKIGKLKLYQRTRLRSRVSPMY